MKFASHFIGQAFNRAGDARQKDTPHGRAWRKIQSVCSVPPWGTVKLKYNQKNEGRCAMEEKEVQTEIIKRLNGLSQESLQQVQLFVHFLQMREKMKYGMDDLGYALALLDERERIHLEGEFEHYRERYPHEG